MNQQNRDLIKGEISAEAAEISPDFQIDSGSSIRGKSIRIGAGVRIGRDVEILCDELFLGDGVWVGDHTKMISPSIRIGGKSRIGANTRASLIQYLEIGSNSNIGSRVSIDAQGFRVGNFLWSKNDIIFGGGGADGPRSFIEIGNYVTIVDKCFINVAERVEIEHGVALSYNVSILTHGLWAPPLEGFPYRIAPVKVGEGSTLYLNAVVLPGVVIGKKCTLAAGGVLSSNLPDGSLAGGVPAKILKTREEYGRSLTPRQIDDYIGQILESYLETFPTKGIELISKSDHSFEMRFADQNFRVRYFPSEGNSEICDADISLSAHELPIQQKGRICHFNIRSYSIEGRTNVVTEDLRDFLRRRGIRIYTEESFSGIRSQNLSRLESLRDSAGKAL